MKNINRERPYYNIKHINEISAWTIAGFSYYPAGEVVEEKTDGNIRIKKIVHSDIGAEVILKETFYDNIKAVRQENTLIKKDDNEIVFSQFSSALLNGIKFDDYSDIIVHYTDFAWQTEGQWKKASLYQLGIQPGGNHGIVGVKRFCGKGTFSTDRHYPLVIVENIKTNTCWYLELEVSTSWYIEIGVKSIDNKNVLYIEGNNSYQQNDGWYLNLKKGESYEAAPAVWGVCDGGFNEAVNELLKYKRAVSLRDFREDIPVVFNNYMNCIWCNQTKEKLIPTIDAAKKAGADIYCMDAGWYTYIGDWAIKEENFSDKTLQGIIDYIKSIGMKAGIWIESESADFNSNTYKKFYDAVFKSHGIPIGGERVVLDFRNKYFYDFMKSVFDKLYKMGIRYIKNDFNKNIGMDVDGKKCASIELRESSLRFYEFINEINELYPDLIIENCGSGAMRCDGGILKYFSLQSTSDLEYYYYYPSVMTGLNACVMPEKAGIWTYPYPHFYSSQDMSDEKYFTDKYIDSRKDGRETVFNMVTSMFGAMYLSGRLDKCDEYNLSLVKEAVTVYKTYSRDIKNSYPVFFEYPINTMDNYNTSFGLYNPENNTLIFGVWNYKGKLKYCVDLSRYKNKNSEIELIYPKKSEIKYNVSGNKVNIEFDSDISAGVFKIKF